MIQLETILAIAMTSHASLPPMSLSKIDVPNMSCLFSNETTKELNSGDYSFRPNDSIKSIYLMFNIIWGQTCAPPQVLMRNPESKETTQLPRVPRIVLIFSKSLQATLTGYLASPSGKELVLRIPDNVANCHYHVNQASTYILFKTIANVHNLCAQGSFISLERELPNPETVKLINGVYSVAAGEY